MAKTRAEIQKAYRERKKVKEGSTYLGREVQRVQKYYRRTEELSNTDLQKRRERIMKSVAKHREKRSTCNKPSSSKGNFFISLDFDKARKRESAIKNARKKISSLEKRIGDLEKANQRIRKRNQRLSARQASVNRTEKSHGSSQSTPRSRTNHQLKEAGLRPAQVHPELRKRLLFGNVLVDEIRESARLNKSTQSKRVIRNIISGRIVKRYRLMRRMSKETRITRNSLMKSNSKSCVMQKRRRLLALYEARKEQIQVFLERDDNSRMMPGKNDAKRSEAGVKVQKRILCDYLYNLFNKFKAENPDEKMSRATFCRLRPGHMMLAAFTSRNTCLCQRHQNLALILRALKSKEGTNTVNPDKFIAENDDDEVKMLLGGLQCASVEYEQWKRVEDQDGKKRMKIVKTEVEKEEFNTIVEKQVSEFREHANRVSMQYAELKRLKQKLPNGEVIAQMDFAENYLCQSCNEVQSAYWNSVMVSLHPAVAYFKGNDGELKHKSFVFVSDELSHNAASVFLILTKFLSESTSLVTPLNRIHYWTDSPTSQYRNKTIFGVIANHNSEFGFPAVWNYFEAEHGKGPCDGVGGTAKRIADEAVKTGKVKIQDANDFFEWATKSEKSSSVTYKFYSKVEYAATVTSLERKYKEVKAVPNTMKLHSVVGISAQKIMVRETSCYCNKCLNDDGFQASPTCEWKAVTILNEVSGPLGTQLALSVNDWVAADYEGNWYIGQVQSIDEDDGEIEVSFMTKGKGKAAENSFKWPTQKDVLWIQRQGILCVIEPPVPVGKTGRTFKLTEATMELIVHRHGCFQHVQH